MYLPEDYIMGTGKNRNKNGGTGCGCLSFLIIGVVIILYLFVPEVLSGFMNSATKTISEFLPLIIILAVLIIATPFILFFQNKAKKKKQEKDFLEIENGIDRISSETLLRTPISQLSPLEYEEFIAAYVKRKGYRNVRTTKASGDFGADVLCEYSYGRKVCIQCKHYNKAVGIEAVQQVLSAKEYYKCDEAWVCASNSFTSAAHELADKTGVKLITIEDTTEPKYNYYVNQKDDDPEDLLYKKIRKDTKKKLDSGMRAHSKQLPYIEGTPEYIKMYPIESHEKVIELKSEPLNSLEAAQHFSECLSDSFLCDSYVEQEGKVYYVYSGYMIKSVVSSYRLNAEDKHYTFANWS